MPKSKSGTDVRDYRLVTYLTREDGRYLTDLAKKLGFKGRSEFVAALLERLIIGGFSPRVFGKLGWQVGKRIREKGADAGSGFYFGIRPLPPLPDEEWTDDEKEEFLAELADESSKPNETNKH